MSRAGVFLVAAILILSAGSGLVAGQGGVTNATANNTIDTSEVEYQIAYVTIHDTTWGSNRITLDVSSRRADKIQITEYHDGRFYWKTYDIQAGELTTIHHQFQQANPDGVAVSVVSAHQGKELTDPTASPITFSRGARWSDHWFSAGTAVLMTFTLVLYRYKRREYFSKTHLRSLLSGRSYRAKEEEKGRVSRVKRVILRHIYSPRSLLLVAIGVLLLEVATGAVFARIVKMGTEMQLALLVAGIGLPGYWYIAGRILRLFPNQNQPKMLTVDNREMGGIDVLTGAKDLFDEMRIKGSKTLHRKPITGTKETIYVAHHYERATHTVVASWHEILDAVEVARNYTAAFVNNYMLENEVDEAREIKSAQPALRQKYQREAQSVAMRKMDETHFEDGRSTNDVMADVVDSIDRNESEETVDTSKNNNSDEMGSESPDGGSNE